MHRFFSFLMALILCFFSFTIAAWAKNGEVNIYTTRQPQLTQPIFEAFTKETGIKVNVLFAKKGIVERIKLEGKNSPADLILMADIGQLIAAVKAGVTQATTLESLSTQIPAIYRDPKGHWFGITTRARAIYASKTRVGEGEITSYEDLANPKWRGRICSRSGRHAYTLALIAAAIVHHGEEKAEVWVRGLKANLARRPQGNDRAQIKAIWAGECDIALGNTYYMGKILTNPKQKPWADSVRIDFPVFEGGGTHLNISGMALAAHAPHQSNAEKLMRFMATASAQSLYGEANFEYPVSTDVTPSALVQSWGNFTPDFINLSDIATHRSAALQLVDRVGFDD